MAQQLVKRNFAYNFDNAPPLTELGDRSGPTNDMSITVTNISAISNCSLIFITISDKTAFGVYAGY